MGLNFTFVPLVFFINALKWSLPLTPPHGHYCASPLGGALTQQSESYRYGTMFSIYYIKRYRSTFYVCFALAVITIALLVKYFKLKISCKSVSGPDTLKEKLQYDAPESSWSLWDPDDVHACLHAPVTPITLTQIGCSALQNVCHESWHHATLSCQIKDKKKSFFYFCVLHLLRVD